MSEPEVEPASESDDGGTSWTDRSAGLPALPMNAIEVDPRNANRVWVAADLGVYQSTNGGAAWTDFASSLPNAFVGTAIQFAWAALGRRAILGYLGSVLLLFVAYGGIFFISFFLQRFAPYKPARSAVEVARLPKDVGVEIECIAAVKSNL